MAGARAQPRQVLILNAGSSTLKWSVLDATTEALRDGGSAACDPQAADAALAPLLAKLGSVDAVGHRVVHGGPRFRTAVRVTTEVRRALAKLREIDPLHTAPALAGIDAVARAAPRLPQVAAFDTAFHTTLPDWASRLPVPWEWTEDWHLRRYGFHGLSVAYCVRRAAELLGESPRRMVVAHLGSGASLTAVADGRSLDTTMSFTPLDGVMMATRSGSLDPGLVLFLARHAGLSVDEISAALEHRSGLRGVSGVSGDLRDVLAAAARGVARAELAYRMFEHSLRRALGAMVAVLEGLDALVFTGGIGEHFPRLRSAVAEAMTFAGLELDPIANETNQLAHGDSEISTPRSTVRVLRIAAREDLTILHAVREVLGVH
jgi:acetate kinase